MSKHDCLAEELRLLEDARARILDPKHWTQGCSAVKADGRPAITKEDEPAAVAWCALGSLYKSHQTLGLPLYLRDRAHRHLSMHCPGGSVVVLNDTEGHAAVIAAFDAAIADLKARVNAAGQIT